MFCSDRLRLQNTDHTIFITFSLCWLPVFASTSPCNLEIDEMKEEMKKQTLGIDYIGYFKAHFLKNSNKQFCFGITMQLVTFVGKI